MWAWWGCLCERIRCEFGLLLGRVRNLGGLLLGFWVLGPEMPRVRAVGKECGLEAHRTEQTLRDLTSHASPEAPVAIRMVCIVDRTWDSPCFVNLIRSTKICSLCSDVLILILSWPFLLKSQALYADEFCRLLGWGLWCRSEDRGARIWSGSRRSPCPVASVLVHRSLSHSLPSLLWWQVDSYKMNHKMRL